MTVKHNLLRLGLATCMVSLAMQLILPGYFWHFLILYILGVAVFFLGTKTRRVQEIVDPITIMKMRQAVEYAMKLMNEMKECPICHYKYAPSLGHVCYGGKVTKI